MSNHPILEFNRTMETGHSFDYVSINPLLNNEYDNHSPLNFHQIEFFVFILYTEGTETHNIDFKEYDCQQGTLLAIRKGQIHKFSHSNLSGHILVFSHEFLGSFFTKAEALKSLLLFNDFLYEPRIYLEQEPYNALLDIVVQIKEEWQNLHDEQSPSIIRSLLQVFISKLYRIKSTSRNIQSSQKFLSEFIQFQNSIETNYTRSLKVQDYARWLGIHSKTLNSITQSVVKKTAKEFIDEICIKNIKIELVNSKLSIKEIGYQSGFEENTNFNNYFKKRVGQTPLEFRNHKK